MRYRLFALLIFAAALVIAVVSDHVTAAGAVPIPPGFRWPAPQQQLVDWSKEQKVSQMRQHAWYLWAGINQPAGSGKVVWETWWSVTSTLHLDEPGAPHGTLTGFNIANINKGSAAAAVSDSNCNPQKFSLTMVPCYGGQEHDCNGYCVTAGNKAIDGKWYANNGDIMIAGEYYNQEAYDHIQKYKLYKKSSLDPGSQAFSSISEFPRRAVVLKYMAWPAQANGLTALPVWDSTPTQPYWNYNGFETWKRAVAIDTTGASIPLGKTASVTYLYNVGHYSPLTFLDAKVVPVTAFYNHRVDKAEWDDMDQGDKCILNQSARWAYNRDFQAGDYLVTIAMHIITKEMPDWAMQTFWWHDRPAEGPDATDRPTDLKPGLWQHYLMTTAWNMVTPREFDGSPYVAMNPYIELVVPELCRMTTNCQNCHTRGAYPTGASGAHYDTSVRGHIAVRDPIFEKVKRTDFQWALPDRAH